MNNISNKLMAEFLGTLFLVTAALLGGGGAAAATLCLSIYAFGHISGGHLNPAVSTAVFLRGRMSQKDLIGYFIAQFSAAVVAFIIWRIISGGNADGHTAPKVDFGKGLIGEFIGTFILATTVLHVATTKALANNQFYGAAIGLAVIGGGAIAGAAGSGGALNPAVGLGIVLSGTKEFAAIAVYLLGCLGGGAVAAIVFRIMLPQEHTPAVTVPSNTPPPPPAE